MAKRKMEYYYRISATQLLAVLIQFPEAERGKLACDLALSLDKGIVPDQFKSLITEGPFAINPFPRPAPATWKKITSRIFARDDYTCAYCGTRGGKLECDHVHPVSRGGLHEDSNLVTSCISCNRSKSATPVDEWRASRNG